MCVIGISRKAEAKDWDGLILFFFGGGGGNTITFTREITSVKNLYKLVLFFFSKEASKGVAASLFIFPNKKDHFVMI